MFAPVSDAIFGRVHSIGAFHASNSPLQFSHRSTRPHTHPGDLLSLLFLGGGYGRVDGDDRGEVAAVVQGPGVVEVGSG